MMISNNSLLRKVEYLIKYLIKFIRNIILGRSLITARRETVVITVVIYSKLIMELQ